MEEALQGILIGMAGAVISRPIEKWLEKRLKAQWLCWLLTIVLTVIVISVPIIIVEKFFLNQ